MKQCTIVIRDEVNIKIEGLDLDCRKALVTAFKYENPAARYLPAVRLGRWVLGLAAAVDRSASHHPFRQIPSASRILKC